MVHLHDYGELLELESRTCPTAELLARVQSETAEIALRLRSEEARAQASAPATVPAMPFSVTQVPPPATQELVGEDFRDGAELDIEAAETEHWREHRWSLPEGFKPPATPRGEQSDQTFGNFVFV